MKFQAFITDNRSILKDFFYFLFVGSIGLELKVKRKELKSLQDLIIVKQKVGKVELPRGRKVTML